MNRIDDTNQALHTKHGQTGEDWLHFIAGVGSKQRVELGVIMLPDFPEKLWQKLRAQHAKWGGTMYCPLCHKPFTETRWPAVLIETLRRKDQLVPPGTGDPAWTREFGCVECSKSIAGLCTSIQRFHERLLGVPLRRVDNRAQSGAVH